MKNLGIKSVAILMLLCSCVEKKTSEPPQSLLEVSKQELATALEERDELLGLMKDIATSMEQIKQIENIMTLIVSQPNENPKRRARMLADVASVQKTLQQRREQLAELESRLEQSTLYTDELKSSVDVLRAQLDSQAREIDALRSQLTMANQQITELNREVDSLNNAVAEKSQDLDEAQAEFERLENQLNTCFYVVATKSQLRDHQIIEMGFLKKAKLSIDDFDQDFFSVGDKRELKHLDLQSNKVKLYTHHPEGSYEIIESGDQKTITILDPGSFWSLTNYLVIQID